MILNLLIVGSSNKTFEHIIYQWESARENLIYVNSMLKRISCLQTTNERRNNSYFFRSFHVFRITMAFFLNTILTSIIN